MVAIIVSAGVTYYANSIVVSSPYDEVKECENLVRNLRILDGNGNIHQDAKLIQSLYMTNLGIKKEIADDCINDSEKQLKKQNSNEALNKIVIMRNLRAIVQKNCGYDRKKAEYKYLQPRLSIPIQGDRRKGDIDSISIDVVLWPCGIKSESPEGYTGIGIIPNKADIVKLNPNDRVDYEMRVRFSSSNHEVVDLSDVYYEITSIKSSKFMLQRDLLALINEDGDVEFGVHIYIKRTVEWTPELLTSAEEKPDEQFPIEDEDDDNFTL